MNEGNEYILSKRIAGIGGWHTGLSPAESAPADYRRLITGGRLIV